MLSQKGNHTRESKPPGDHSLVILEQDACQQGRLTCFYPRKTHRFDVADAPKILAATETFVSKKSAVANIHEPSLLREPEKVTEKREELTRVVLRPPLTISTKREHDLLLVVSNEAVG